MSAYDLGVIIGALVGTLLFTRIGLWLTKKMGDNASRLIAAYVGTYAVMVVLGGYGYADGGPPRFVYAATIYALPLMLWMAVDFLALRGRQARGKN